tara:strand:- start:1959 stop:4070 length:2112 start_codon:yes stop_codon:yes gene_type:complete
MSDNATEVLKKLLEKYNIEPSPEETDDQGLTFSEKIRLAAQGALFNFSDEAIAAIRAIGPETYSEALQKERSALKTAQDKPGSLKYEIGGALGSGIAAAPFTGGASLVPTLGRAAAVGAGAGSLAGAGGGEGFGGRLEGAGIGAVVGGVAGPVGTKAVQLGTTLLKKPADFIRRKLTGRLGKAAEDEVLRIMREGNLTLEDVVKKVNAGEIIPDMSEQTANALRSIYAKSGSGGQIIADTLTRRADETFESGKRALLSELAPEGGENITLALSKNLKELEAAESAAYKEIFDQGKALQSNSLNLSAEQILTNQKFLQKDINKLLKASNAPDLFKITDGKLELLRDVTLEDGEIIRRALADATNKAFSGGKGNLGTSLNTIEKSVRSILDDVSPELAATRAKWASIKAAQQAFEDGKKAFGKSFEDLSIQFDNLAQRGDDLAMDSFRAGVAAQLKNKFGLSSAKSFMSALSKLERKERDILEKIYPEGMFEDTLKKLELASKTQTTKGRVLGGSPTAITAEGVKRVGADAAVDVVEFALNPLNIFAFTRMARKMIGSKVDNISQAQLEQAAKILVSEDADLIQRALTDRDALSILSKRVGQLLDSLTAGTTTASAFTAEKFAPDSIISPAFAGEVLSYPQFVESGGMVVDSGSPISAGAYSQYLQSIGAQDTTIGAISELPSEINTIIENLPENTKKKIIESVR